MTSFLMHFIVLRLVILLLLIITTFFSIYAFIAVLRLKRKVKKLQRTIEQMQKDDKNSSSTPDTNP